jgi:hypothetical protein
MKKDDIQPDKPNKKPQKKAVNKSSPKKQKPTSKPKYILDLDAVGKDSKAKSGIVLPKGRGITLNQWKELADKDPLQLTANEAKQLTEANKMAIEFGKQIAERYDFSSLFKSIEVIPFPKIAEDMQRFTSVVEALRFNFTIPAQQLAQFQQNMAITTSVMSKALIDAANVANIARSFFADLQAHHEQIIKALSIDIASLGSRIAQQLTDSQTIDFNFRDVSERDGLIVASGNASKIQRVDDYVLIDKGSLDFVFTELHATRAELSEIKGMISKGLQSGITKIAYADATFRREASKLVIKGFEIVIVASSKQAQFCEVFLRSASDFTKRWDVEDFILEALGERFSKNKPEKYWLGILRNYVFQLNRNILGATEGQFSDFFVLLGSEIYINPKYFSNL